MEVSRDEAKNCSFQSDVASPEKLLKFWPNHALIFWRRSLMAHCLKFRSSPRVQGAISSCVALRLGTFGSLSEDKYDTSGPVQPISLQRIFQCIRSNVWISREFYYWRQVGWYSNVFSLFWTPLIPQNPALLSLLMDPCSLIMSMSAGHHIFPEFTVELPLDDGN